MDTEIKRTESEIEVDAYVANLKYAIESGAQIIFQAKRMVDEQRDKKYTNEYTVANLFPDDDPKEALRRELLTLTTKEYICTVKDINRPKLSEMRVFGKTYNGDEDVYIKIRIELFNPENANNKTAFVMSFHFAETDFKKEDFPYLNR